MSIESNGRKGVGAIVLPYSAEYNIKIASPGKLDLFTLTTCHREHIKESAGRTGFFGGGGKEVEYVFTPVEGIERGEYACPIQLGGYEQKKGRHAWGFIDFESPSLELTALIKCNGWTRHSRGVSVCQSREGLIQYIEFNGQTLAASSCASTTSDDRKVFRYKAPKGECVIRFKDLLLGDEHRHTVIGYEGILIRED